MIQCNRCHLQYIGETKRRLKDRFNEHRRSVDKTNVQSKPTTVAEHFLSHPNHCHIDIQLIPLEIIHSSRDSRGASRIFHRRGAPLRNDVTDGEVKKFNSEYVYTKKKASSQGWGGGSIPCTLPLDAPLRFNKKSRRVLFNRFRENIGTSRYE